jgi:hypothetical protein
MKGQSEVIEILVFIAFAFVFVFLLAVILPKYLYDINKLFSLISADVVAKDLSGLITVSGVVTNKITIYYSPSGVVTYNVGIKDRIVNVELLESKDKVKEKSSPEKTAVDPQLQESNVNSFTIMKSIENNQIVYEVMAK